jgi:hypothetical protein
MWRVFVTGDQYFVRGCHRVKIQFEAISISCETL